MTKQTISDEERALRGREGDVRAILEAIQQADAVPVELRLDVLRKLSDAAEALAWELGKTLVQE